MDSDTLPKLPAGVELPELQHPEFLALWRYDLRMPMDKMEGILLISDAEACVDASAILWTALHWEKPYRAAGHETVPILPPDRSFILHALNLLAEKHLPDCLSALLDFARLPKETLSFWLGKFLEESFWEMLYHFVRDDFSAMGPFVREKDLALPIRVAALDCMAQIAWKQPIKRLEVFDWYRDLFRDVLEGKVEMDGECLGWAVRNVVDLRARSLVAEIGRLYAEKDVHQGIAGDWETVKKEMDWPVKSWARREVFDLKGRYAYMVATLYPSTPEEKATEVKLHRVKPPKPGKGQLRVMGRKKTPLRKGVKVGRNAPCPCGSGKKYKKCCGG